MLLRLNPNSRLGWLMISMACLGTFGMMQIPNSATQIFDYKYFGLHVGLLGLWFLAAILVGISSPKRTMRIDSLWRVGLGLWILGLAISAAMGPFPHRSRIVGLVPQVMLLVGFMLWVHVSRKDLWRSANSLGSVWGIPLLLIGLGSVSLTQFMVSDVLPAWTNAQQLDRAAGGGLFALLWQEALPNLRNGYPFGHANYVSGFWLLALPCLGYSWIFGTKSARVLTGIAGCIGIGVLLSTQSRNAVAGLILLAVCGGMIFRDRISWTKATGVLLAACVVGIFWLIPRFSLKSFLISSDRLGVWKIAWKTGQTYFPFGAGEGMTPEMMQLFSADSAAQWPGALQFHHTWLHVWAVSGLLGTLGLGLLTVLVAWSILRLGYRPFSERVLAAPSACALSAIFLVFWADYQWDVLPIAGLMIFHLIVLGASGRSGLSSGTSTRSGSLFPVLMGIPLLVSFAAVPDALTYRAHLDAAASAVEHHELREGVDQFVEASEIVDEPYPLNMAGMILSRFSENQDKAIQIFSASLDVWEAQAVAHDFLSELYKRKAAESESPDQKKILLEKAYVHARRRLDLAPEVQGSYLDLAALSRLLDRPDSEVLELLKLELLSQGDLLFPMTWQAYPLVRDLESSVKESIFLHSYMEGTRLEDRRAWAASWLWGTGQAAGVEVSIDLQEIWNRRLDQNAGLRLINEACQQSGNIHFLSRPLLYAFRAPLDVEQQSNLRETISPTEDCVTGFLLAPFWRLQQVRWSGVGLGARNPYGLPVQRLMLRPDVVMSRFLGKRTSRILSPTESWDLVESDP